MTLSHAASSCPGPARATSHSRRRSPCWPPSAVPSSARSMTAPPGRPRCARRTSRCDPRPAAPRDLGGQLPAKARAGAITEVQPVNDGLAVVGATWARGDLARGRPDRAADPARRGVAAVAADGGRRRRARPGPGHGRGPGGPGRAPLPVVVEGDASQVRVVTSRTTAPTVDVTFVDPGTSDADASAGAPGGGQRRPRPRARPTIYTRKDWGADESLRKGTPEYGQVQVGFVHHTVGTNTYTAAQVPAIIRGIYDFHVNGRGWNDVGYQFLVDRFGRIWEGRAGGVDKAVVGAQAGGYNSGSFGASVMGDFSLGRRPLGGDQRAHPAVRVEVHPPRHPGHRTGHGRWTGRSTGSRVTGTRTRPRVRARACTRRSPDCERR